MDRTWLGLSSEEAIESELEIVDPHHHLWDVETRFGRYELDDLQRDTTAGHRVVETVFVECRSNHRDHGPTHLRPVGETDYVAAQAALSANRPGATIGAIVGYADLTAGAEVAEALDAHLEASNGLFRGIRHIAARDDDPDVPPSWNTPPADLYRSDRFLAGARALADRGLSFDAWQYHTQLDLVADLAQAVPELTIIVNHLGGPLGIGAWSQRRDEVRAGLRSGLEALAVHDNVVLKVGGIGMGRLGAPWVGDPIPPTSDQVVEHWGDVLRHAIDTFGPSRAMFESNYPVDGETIPYAVLWNAFKKVSADYDGAERSNLFAGTARRVYRL